MSLRSTDMSIARVTKHGERVLKIPCPPIDYASVKADLPSILKTMWVTMATARGVGLAAPQIGLSLRLAIIDIRPEGKSSRLVLINPELISVEGEQKEEEGCLSIPGVYARLKRYAKARVRALDEHGRLRELVGEGLLARAFQHEIDHLDGKLFVDRLPFEEKLKVLDVIKDVKASWT